jgi:excisionase family DNA binding protein
VERRLAKLNSRQIAVSQWIADGCPERNWPTAPYKNSAQALDNRGLVDVQRRRKIWTASITDAGRYYLAHGGFEPRLAFELEELSADEGPALTTGQHQSDHPAPDATARAMRRVAARKKPTKVVQSRREIKETYMRYKVVVTRVQVAERFVRAPSEEEAAAKIQEEFDRPYGYFGSWKTTSSEIDVIEAEQTTVIGPTHLANNGTLLLSLKDAAKALGISYSTLYQMMNQGDIEWVAVGSRKFVSRENLMGFIKANTHSGYYVAR